GLAWPIVHQRPGPLALLGMFLTLSGTAFVFTAPAKRRHGHGEGGTAMGILSGLLGAVGQAGGYVLSKLALRTGLDPLEATVIRIAAAMLGVWALAAVRGEAGGAFAALHDRAATLFMVGGAFFGPVLGVTLLLFALPHP